jgi:hypothetical protein
MSLIARRHRAADANVVSTDAASPSRARSVPSADSSDAIASAT